MFLCPQGYNSQGDPTKHSLGNLTKQHEVQILTDLNACFLIDRSADLSFIDYLHLQIINFNNYHP